MVQLRYLLFICSHSQHVLSENCLHLTPVSTHIYNFENVSPDFLVEDCKIRLVMLFDTEYIFLFCKGQGAGTKTLFLLFTSKLFSWNGTTAGKIVLIALIKENGLNDVDGMRGLLWTWDKIFESYE